MQESYQKFDTAEQSEEISLKEVILKGLEIGKYLVRNWVVILIISLLGAGVGLITAFVKKPTYVADLTFVLEDTKSNPLSSYAGIASQFGIDLGGGGGMGLFTGENILGFLKSRLMVEKALISPVRNSNNQLQSLADLYIDTYEMRKDWKGKADLANISIPYNKDRAAFSLQQDSILLIIYNKILKNNLDVSKPDKKINIIDAKCTSKSELFSLTFIERLVKEATDFYVATKTKRALANVEKLEFKADSLEKLLNQKTYDVAARQDINMNAARRVVGVGAEVAGRDKMVLQTVYGEVVKNLELSRMTMSQETPIFQVVDVPILPLEKEKLSKTKGLLIGAILGGILAVVGLIGIHIYKEVMLS